MPAHKGTKQLAGVHDPHHVDKNLDMTDADVKFNEDLNSLKPGPERDRYIRQWAKRYDERLGEQGRQVQDAEAKAERAKAAAYLARKKAKAKAKAKK